MPYLLPNFSRHTARCLAALTFVFSVLCILLLLTIAWLTTLHTYRQAVMEDAARHRSLIITRGNLYFTFEDISDTVGLGLDSEGFEALGTHPRDADGDWNTYLLPGEGGRCTPEQIDEETPSWGLFQTSAFGTRAIFRFGTGFAIPTYVLQILLLLPIALSLHLLRKTRYSNSHCQSCGYNLTGNPSAPACPECGKPTPTPNPKIQT